MRTLGKHFGYGRMDTLSLRKIVNGGPDMRVASSLTLRANVITLKTAFLVAKWSKEHVAIGSKGGFVKVARTRWRSYGSCEGDTSG